jgi:hypothetical protein
MAKKRRVSAGKAVPATQQVPFALENELLALLLSSSQTDTERLQRRLRQRHPSQGEAESAAIVQRCLRAKEDGYALVAAEAMRGGSQAHAAGRILAAHPWISMENLDTLCSQGYILAIR